MSKTINILSIFVIMSCISLGFVSALYITSTKDSFNIKNELYVNGASFINNSTSINGLIVHNEYMILKVTPERTPEQILTIYIHEMAHKYAFDDPEHFCGWYK